MRVRGLLAMLVAATGLSQTRPDGSALEFEAASVKAVSSTPLDLSRPQTLASSLPSMNGGPGTATPGRIRYSNVTLKGLILEAYEFESDQVVGPGWLIENRYQLDAVVPAGATKAQFRQMLQHLLQQRFQLVVRWDERPFHIYRLGIAPGGPTVKPSVAKGPDDEDYDMPTKLMLAAKSEVDSDGCPVLPPTHRATVGRRHCTTYVGFSMPDLALQLGRMVGNETGSNFGPNKSWAHVIDATGLAGRFDFTLRYDAVYHAMINTPGLDAMRSQITTDNPVSIFKAVEAQLGLRLEPTTSNLKVMVIQHVERIPTEN